MNDEERKLDDLKNADNHAIFYARKKIRSTAEYKRASKAQQDAMDEQVKQDTIRTR